MSKLQIEQYYKEVEEAIQFGDSEKESSLRRYFANLIEFYSKQKKLHLIDEKSYRNVKNRMRYPDGSLQLKGINVGHWESKDIKDDLEKEIVKKFEAGYPQYNILFENSQVAILYQAPNKRAKGQKVKIANMKNWIELHDIITKFIEYETEEVRQFRQALSQFTEKVPKISKLLKAVIAISIGNATLDDYDTDIQLKILYVSINQAFISSREQFLKNCRLAIDETLTLSEIDEMIVQHILTENIFNTIFGQVQFHRENNIAKELSQVIETFFYSEIRQNTTDQLEDIYATFQAEASQMKIYQEKQKFLKLIYEEFYKVYNEKGADRLGIVYTPNEIVQFILNNTQKILYQEFRKTFANEEVEILDPATGTGTFICDLIEMLPKNALERKFEKEIHANEISILAYYIANLNIEYTFKEKMGHYKRFHNICFVDTLEILNHAGNRSEGVQQDLYGISFENLKRIKNQSKSKISVIIGNPPYNANQLNENDNNKNKVYLRKSGSGKNDFIGVDQRIKETYIKQSTAQKTKQYDMYKRFIRWASDRIDENGVIGFVVNRSFIDKRQDDGFRKCIQQEFDFAYIIDLNGDLRVKGVEAKDNVFGIMIGVAILILVKKQKKRVKKVRDCRIFYHPIPSFPHKSEKLSFLAGLEWEDIDFEEIEPDEKGNWIDQTDNDFDTLIPICDRQVKLGKKENAIFKLFSFGVSTNRDDWVYDFSKENLENKIQFFIQKYNGFLESNDTSWDTSIKWSEFLKNNFKRKIPIYFKKKLIKIISYRHFIKKFYYAEKLLSDRLTQNHYDMFGNSLNKKNHIITISQGNRANFYSWAIDSVPNLDIYMPNAASCLPLYRYDLKGNRIDNITDWGLIQFQNHYANQAITKLDIFNYTYAVLHNPAYREKYALNLKRDFPRLPFYDNFNQWVLWGKQLMDLHLNYETAKKYPLKRIDIALHSAENKVKLKSDKESGKIVLDAMTTLQGVPANAWAYQLGNRSALEWILDQYKEKKPRDKTIREKFNTYKFSDYKEQVIELLQRVCTVSVETMKIIGEMIKQ